MSKAELEPWYQLFDWNLKQDGPDLGAKNGGRWIIASRNEPPQRIDSDFIPKQLTPEP